MPLALSAGLRCRSRFRRADTPLDRPSPIAVITTLRSIPCGRAALEAASPAGDAIGPVREHLECDALPDHRSGTLVDREDHPALTRFNSIRGVPVTTDPRGRNDACALLLTALVRKICAVPRRSGLSARGPGWTCARGCSALSAIPAIGQMLILRDAGRPDARNDGQLPVSGDAAGSAGGGSAAVRTMRRSGTIAFSSTGRHVLRSRMIRRGVHGSLATLKVTRVPSMRTS